MTNPQQRPDDRTMRELIAERLGWTDISTEPVYRTLRPIKADHRLWGNPPDGKIQRRLLPDWSGDRNASKDLPVKDLTAFNRACETLEKEWLKENKPEEWDYRCSSEFESLAWILSEHGYRWVPCRNQTVDICDNEYHDLPCDLNHHCAVRLCRGGKFEEVKS